MEVKNAQGHKKESCIRLKSIVPVIICVCIYLCFLTESHWLLIETKKRKMFAEKCVWKLQKKDFNQNYVFNFSTSVTQLESEFFLLFTVLVENSCLWWHRQSSPAFCFRQHFMLFSFKLTGTILSIFLFPLGTRNTRIRITASVLLKILTIL